MEPYETLLACLSSLSLGLVAGPSSGYLLSRRPTPELFRHLSEAQKHSQALPANGQVRSGQVRSGQVRFRSGQVRSGLVCLALAEALAEALSRGPGRAGRVVSHRRLVLRTALHVRPCKLSGLTKP